MISLGMSLILLLISGLSEVFADLRRKKADLEENSLEYIKMVDDR
jgi:hypothetical protein